MQSNYKSDQPQERSVWNLNSRDGEKYVKLQTDCTSDASGSFIALLPAVEDLKIRTSTSFILINPPFQNLQSLDHMALFKEFTNGDVTKPLGADQGGEVHANLCSRKGRVFQFGPSVGKSLVVEPYCPVGGELADVLLGKKCS